MPTQHLSWLFNRVPRATGLLLTDVDLSEQERLDKPMATVKGFLDAQIFAQIFVQTVSLIG